MKPIDASPEMDRPCADPTCECCYPNNYCHYCIGWDVEWASIGSIFSCRVCHSVYQKLKATDSPHFDRLSEAVQSTLVDSFCYVCLDNHQYVGPLINAKI